MSILTQSYAGLHADISAKKCSQLIAVDYIYLQLLMNFHKLTEYIKV